MSVSTFKTWSSIFINELSSTKESGQKEPHCNNRDASSRVREHGPMLLILNVSLYAAHAGKKELTNKVGCYCLTDRN
eukprot:5212998-Amphidinium_carterae.1